MSLGAPADFPLTVRRSRGLSGSVCWVSGSNQNGWTGVNPFGATATALFRQVSADAPLLTISTTSSALGSIQYLPPIANYPWVPPLLNGEIPPIAPITLTIYPIAISLTPAGGKTLLYPYCYWDLSLTFIDGSEFPFLTGLVTVTDT